MGLLSRGSRAGGPPQPWGTGRLAALLVAAVAAVAALAVGAGLAVYFAVSGGGAGPGSSPASPAALPGGPAPASAAPSGYDQKAADELAAAPMRSVPLEASQPGPISTRVADTLQVPRPTMSGPAGVATGYPQTPEGALGQLASIGKTAMQTASIAGVRSVIEAWAAPGGPDPGTWSGTQAMAGLLSSAGLSGDGNAQMTLSVTPVMGLIKGSVGDTFVVPCVLYEFAMTVNATARVGVADCQRMVWADGRWMVAPGSEPSLPPSVWPGTGLAIEVGYRTLRYV
jgi:hypothetical protein